MGFVRGEFVQHFLQSEKCKLPRLVDHGLVHGFTDHGIYQVYRIVSSSELHSGNSTWNLNITCFLQGNSSSKPSCLGSMLIFRGVDNKKSRAPWASPIRFVIVSCLKLTAKTLEKTKFKCKGCKIIYNFLSLFGKPDPTFRVYVVMAMFQGW